MRKISWFPSQTWLKSSSVRWQRTFAVKRGLVSNIASGFFVRMYLTQYRVAARDVRLIDNRFDSRAPNFSSHSLARSRFNFARRRRASCTLCVAQSRDTISQYNFFRSPPLSSTATISSGTSSRIRALDSIRNSINTQISTLTPVERMLAQAARAGDCTPRGETQRRNRQYNGSQLPHRGPPPRRALRHLARHLIDESQTLDSCCSPKSTAVPNSKNDKKEPTAKRDKEKVSDGNPLSRNSSARFFQLGRRIRWLITSSSIVLTYGWEPSWFRLSYPHRVC